MLKMSLISIFSFFLSGFKHDFIRCVDFKSKAALNTARLVMAMVSQIRSHIEYLTHHYYILVLIL